MADQSHGPARRRTTARLQLADRLLIAVLMAALVATLDVMVVWAVNPTRVLTQQHYYLALGDSLSFGYQPDLNFTAGYVDDVFADLRGWGVTDVVNLACAGETTTTMIEGNCPVRLIQHADYTTSQLDAAVAFLRKHPTQVSPITLDIGVNDIVGYFSVSPSTGTCGPTPGAMDALAAMDQNLTHVILPRLQEALGGPSYGPTANLVMLNYYDPYALVCPASLAFVSMLNTHLAADAAPFRIPIVDIFDAFGGTAQAADNVCIYTWYCDAQQDHDFHPTSAGYRVMAEAVEHVIGYGASSGGNFVPAIPPFNALGLAPRRRRPPTL